MGYQPGLCLDDRERESVADRMQEVGLEMERVGTSQYQCDCLNGANVTADDLSGRTKAARSLYAEGGRFRDCGKFFFYWQCRRGRKCFKTVSRCKSRVCPECARIYRHRVWTPIYDMLQEVNARKRRGFRMAMLTLTVSSNRFDGRMPDRSDLARFHKESALFFRLFFGKWQGRWGKTGKIHEDRKHWKGAGFIAVTEVGFHNNNLHLHAIVWSQYVDQAKLKEAWERITGDSFGVHISEVRTPKGAANYIGSYIQKVPNREGFTDLADIAIMLKGSRRLRTGGIFYHRFSTAPLHRALRCPICGGELRSVNRSRIDDLDQVPLLWHARDAGKLAPDDPDDDHNHVSVGEGGTVVPCVQKPAYTVHLSAYSR